MPRLAGDTPGYKFSLIDKNTNEPTSHSFELRSVTQIIETVIAKPFGAGMWTGWRNALEDVAGTDASEMSAEELETLLKSKDLDPNKRLKGQAHRGQNAHDVLEHLAKGNYEYADELVGKERQQFGTAYGEAVQCWWWDSGMDANQPTLKSELPVWSLSNSYAGTLDLYDPSGGGKVIDLKTHKPAAGFTKRGAAYLSDIIQVRAYRTALSEMGDMASSSNLILIARDNGKYLEDDRQVTEEFWLKVLDMDREIRAGGWV